jgi:hypothetical protein
LIPDTSGEPLRHPELEERFAADETGGYRARNQQIH